MHVPNCLALASAIWGATTWLSSIVRTYPQFLITRASTGVDDSSYPGLYTLVADYFGPNMRGKVYGICATRPADWLPVGHDSGIDGRPDDRWLAFMFFTLPGRWDW